MIAIVTDSTSYITREEAAALGIRIVPMSYTVAGRLYHENYSDRNGSFEKLISHSGSCSTAQASVAAFTSVFAELVRNNYEVLCLVISSKLSGTYSSASIAAREVDREKIVVVDSLSTAGGLYLLAKRAWAYAKEGHTLFQTAALVESLRSRTGIVFSVDDMENLRKSGRLGIVRQSVGTVLNIRPILLCEDGGIIASGTARGKYNQINELVKRVPASADALIVHYLVNPDKAQLIICELRRRFPDTEIKLMRLGPVLGIHLGVDTVGVSWLEN